MKTLNACVQELGWVGWIPLVFIGLGLVNIFFPTAKEYTGIERIFLSALLLLSGFLAWTALAVWTYKRWSRQMESAEQREAKMISAIVRIVENSPKSTSKLSLDRKVKLLTDSFSKLPQ